MLLYRKKIEGGKYYDYKMLSKEEKEYLRQKRMEKIMIRKSFFLRELQNIIIGYCGWKYVVKRKLDEKMKGFSKGKIVFYSDLKDIVIAKIYVTKRKIYLSAQEIDVSHNKRYEWLCYQGKPYSAKNLIKMLRPYGEEGRKIRLDDYSQGMIKIYKIVLLALEGRPWQDD